MSNPVSSSLGYDLVDADNHYYEPHDCFTRHMEKKFLSQAVHHVPNNTDNLARVYIGDDPFFWRPIAIFDRVGTPGSAKGAIESRTDDFEDPKFIAVRDYPEYFDRTARLKLMDKQGIQAAIMLPTEAVAVEAELYRYGPEVAFANLRAFNHWLEDDWGYSYKDRLFAVPLLSLVDIDLAVEELEWVLELGARAVHLKAGPAHGHSPADELFDPFWARVQEADIPVLYHFGNSGYQDMIGKSWGLPTTLSIYEETPFQVFLTRICRPITDTLASLVLGDVFGRFPRLRIVSVEHGSSWVGPLLKEMDHTLPLSRIKWSSRPGKPSDIFKEHVYVAPFWEDSGTELAEILGADHVLLGSDFPHPEGEADPANFVKSLEGMCEEDQRKVMRENTAELIGLAI